MVRIDALAPRGNVLRRGAGYPTLLGRRPIRDPRPSEIRFLVRRLVTARELLLTRGQEAAAEFVDCVGFSCQVARCRLLVEFALLAETILYGDRDLALHDIGALEAQLRQELEL